MQKVYKVEKENKLTLGVKKCRPYSDLYFNNTMTLNSNTCEEIYLGIKKITSEDENVVFYILGENGVEENQMVETKSKFVGLNTPIYVEKQNNFHLEHKYNKDELLAHMVALKCYTGPIVEVESLDETNRGENAYGSTGTK